MQYITFHCNTFHHNILQCTETHSTAMNKASEYTIIYSFRCNKQYTAIHYNTMHQDNSQIQIQIQDNSQIKVKARVRSLCVRQIVTDGTLELYN